MENRSQTGQPFLNKFLSFLGINRSADTAEDLGNEIQELIEDGEDQGIISSQEGMMISSIIDFGETLVSEIMTPRTAMICAPSNAPGADLVSLIIENGFTRIPIYADSPDQIIGIIHAKVLLRYCTDDYDTPVAGDMVNPAFFVRENHKIIDLLKDFKTKKIHMAIVVDEFRGIRGIVTFEDILEEIVGEIEDEYDQDNTRWTEVDENTILTDAKVDIEELESFFKLEMPDGPYESIGGLVISQMGELPSTGDTIRIKGLSFKVISASTRRINTVQVQRDS
jgi:CBS domain containing-hemolysin-like protein